MNFKRHKFLQKKYEWLNIHEEPYGRFFWKPVVDDIIDPIINRRFQNYTSMIDLGCGGGNYLHTVDSRYTKIYGLDWAVDIQEKQKKKIGDRLVNLFPGDVCDIQLPDKSVDVAMSNDMFEHLHESMVDKAFSEIARVTRYKAHFVIAMSPSSYHNRVGKEFGEGEGQLHETVKPKEWWKSHIDKYFTIEDRHKSLARFTVSVK